AAARCAAALTSVLPGEMFRSHLLPAARRAVPRLSRGRTGQRSAGREPQLERPMVPTNASAARAHARSGPRTQLSIPPPLVARTVAAEMRAAPVHLLPALLSAVVHRFEQPFLQPIYDLESEAMAQGRAAPIGDAAFVVCPHVGAGSSRP